MEDKLDLAIKEFDPTKKKLWQGNLFNKFAFMQLYIEKLYGNDLHYMRFTDIAIVFTKEYENYNFIIGPIFLSDKLNKVWQLLDVPKEYLNEYIKTNKRFTLYPIRLIDENDNKNGHVLYMLYDKKYNKIEVFDNTIHINVIVHFKRKIFIDFFKKIYGKNIKFDFKNYGFILSKYAVKYCNTGIYSIKNTCVLWFLWFLELRLSNKTLKTKEIVDNIKDILDKNPTKICEILLGYAQFVDKVTYDYKCLIIDKKFEGVILKSHAKTKIKRKRITVVLASLITLLSSIYLLRKKFLNSKSVKK